MMTSPRLSATGYPLPLRTAIAHAFRFARTVAGLHADAATDNAAFLWLEGRAEEVRVFTWDVIRAWSAGEVTTEVAVEVIDGYLEALHASLEPWYGRWFAPSCCGPHVASSFSKSPESGVTRRADTLADTVADVEPEDVQAEIPTRVDFRLSA